MQLYEPFHRLPPIIQRLRKRGLAVGVVIILAFYFVLRFAQPVAAHASRPTTGAATAGAATAALLVSQATTTTVIYVDQAVGGGVHDGASWATAYTTLQDALAAATSNVEIWVADGIYYPDEGGGATANSRSASFQLKNNVALYGGFAGGEGSRDERAWQTNLTILSGDLSQNDPDKNSNGLITNPATISTPNAYHVVLASSVNSSAVLDGFTITGGKADGAYADPCGLACGGGMFVDGGSPTLRNLTIAGNGASYYGAGLATVNSTLTATSLILQANRASISGGALYNRGGSPSYSNLLISGNRSDSRGGGIFNDRVASSLQLINATISGNRASISGGGLYNSQATVIIGNTIIWNNYANMQSEMSNATSTPVIYNSLIKNAFPSGTWDSTLGVNNGDNLSGDPLFTAPLDYSTAPVIGGDYSLKALSPAADGGELSVNATTLDVVGAVRWQGATVDMGAHESPHTAQLTMRVAATPALIEYGETVTYTIVLSNSGNAFAYQALMTDTLPANTSFSHWLEQPAGAAYQSDDKEITWSGSIAASQAVTYSFAITHTGGPAETVTNTVAYGHVTSSNSAAAAFQVATLPIASITDVTVAEAGKWANFTVTLNKTTRKTVTLDYVTANITAMAPADYSARNTNLTILPGQSSGFMIIPITSDFVDEQDESFKVNLSNAVNATLAKTSATATITDDDTAGGHVSPTDLEVSEPDSSANFTITLHSQPVAAVNVTLSNSDTSECSVPATIQLTPANWQGVGVNVVAVNDFVVDGDQSCRIGLTVASSDPLYHGMALDEIVVTVRSDDVAGIGLAPSALTISEPAQSKAFTITLTSQPTATVTVDLSSSDPSECSVPASVTLDETNWAQGINVLVSAVDDAIDDDDQPCTIQTTVHSVDPNYDGRAMSNLPVTVQDEDTAGVTVTPTSLTTSEPNGGKPFAVALNSEPTAPVTVAFSVSDPSECTTPPSIVLDGSNWNALVTVAVTALDDRIDDGNQLCQVQTTVTSSDAKYNGIAADDVAVTVQDDGDQAGVKLTPSALTVSEPNTTATFTVTLDSQPLFPVTIAFASQDSGECSVPASVVLNVTNWAQGKTVTVTGVNDDLIDGPQSCVITTNATSSDTNYQAIAVVDPTVTVQDDDHAEVLISASNPAVTEPSTSTALVFKLTSQPTAPVTVTLQSGDPDECSVLTNVVLTPSNWKTGVGTTVQAVDDDIDDDDRLCHVQATVASGDSHYHTLAVQPFAITVHDNDTAGTVVSPQSLQVSEPNSAAVFTVTLTSEPTATVTVNLFSNDLSECSVPTTVAISPAQWRTGVGVTVTAVDDAIKDNTRPCLVQTTTSSSNAKYNAIAIADVSVTVADDDQAGVVVAPTTLTTSEPDGTTNFTITLTSEPTATVTVNLVSTEVSECSVPASVALDATNWAQGVVVPVNAMNDDIDDGAQNCSVQTIVSSVDRSYAGISAADVTVTVEDDSDSAGTLVSTTVLTVSEPSESTVFTVALTSEPLTPVTIQLVSSDPGECSAPNAVVLDPTNWATGVGVTVSAVNDEVDDETQICLLQTNATSTDPGYHGMSIADLTVTVQDEDSAGIAVNQTVFTVTEPSSAANFTITLNSEPVAPVTVHLTSSDPGECAVPASAVLNASNWRRGLGVTASAVNDDVMDGSQLCTVTTTVASADPNYAERFLDDLTVTVADEDVAGVTVTPTTFTLAELDGAGIFTVALTSEPTAAVAINLLSSDVSECSVPTGITLTSQNWRRGLPVTIQAVDDNQADGDQPCQVTITAVSADPVYAAFAIPAVDATVRDDDRIAVFILTTTLTLAEPAGATNLTARLGSEPTAPVTISFAVNDHSECVAPAAVTLTPLNWRTGVTIKVTALDDHLDDGPQSCQLSAQAASLDPDYADYPIDSVTLTVNDDDLPALAFAAWPDRIKAEVGEVITYTYQVTNTGDVTLTTQLVNSGMSALNLNATHLAPGAVMTHVAHYTVREADLPGPLENIATVTAQSPMGTVVTATEALTVDLSALPQLAVEVVRLGPPHVVPGTVVTYQVSITNVGHIAAHINSLQGTATVQAATAAAATNACTAPQTIAAGASYRCILLWSAVKADPESDEDAVQFIVTVEATGLLNFTATVSNSATVVVSPPTGVAPTKVYLPLVGR